MNNIKEKTSDTDEDPDIQSPVHEPDERWNTVKKEKRKQSSPVTASTVRLRTYELLKMTTTERSTTASPCRPRPTCWSGGKH